MFILGLYDGHLFEVILPPFVTVGDVQGIQVFQGTSVISEGHLGYPLQDLVELLLAQGLGAEERQEEPSGTQVRLGTSVLTHSQQFIALQR